jgi:hypothetical protein
MSGPLVALKAWPAPERRPPKTVGAVPSFWVLYLNFLAPNVMERIVTLVDNSVGQDVGGT